LQIHQVILEKMQNPVNSDALHFRKDDVTKTKAVRLSYSNNQLTAVKD